MNNSKYSILSLIFMILSILLALGIVNNLMSNVSKIIQTLAIGSIISGVISILLGIYSFADIKRNKKEGKSLSVTSIVISILDILILIFVYLISFGPQ